ncbi:MAG: hypothetical protein H8E40_07790 [Chloroflexi bacterium]|nr:hypothetical protein [Chloroflexota bacterium]
MKSAGNELSSLREQYHKLVDSSSLNSKDTLGLAARCRELIFHIHQRIEYCEKRRGQMVIISLSLLAAAVALFAATFLEAMDSELLVSLARLAALLLFLTAAITLGLYALQTNFKYPFVQITKTWRWFYHYSVSKEYKPPFFPFEGPNQREKMQKMHLQDMLTYAERTLGSSSKEELEQDLEQLFLVIVDEKYKNVQLTHLRMVISCGLGLTILVMIAIAIVAI